MSTCELMWLRPWQRRASAKVRVCDPPLPSCSSCFPSLSFLFLSLFSSPLSFSLFFPFPFSRGVWRFSRPVPFWDWFGAASTRGPFPSSGKGLQASCSLRFSSFFPFFLFFFCFLLLFLLFVFSRRKKMSGESYSLTFQHYCKIT